MGLYRRMDENYSLFIKGVDKMSIFEVSSLVFSSMSLILCGVVYYFYYRLRKSERLLQSLQVENSKMQRKIDQHEETRSFRLIFKNPIECEFRIKQLDDQPVTIDKNANGSILNISRTGMLFESDFNFPVEKRDVFIEFNFTLDKVKFCLNGKLVRKEMRNQNEQFYYGVTFKDVPNKVGRELSLSINRIDIVQRQSIERAS